MGGVNLSISPYPLAADDAEHLHYFFFRTIFAQQQYLCYVCSVHTINIDVDGGS